MTTKETGHLSNARKIHHVGNEHPTRNMLCAKRKTKTKNGVQTENGNAVRCDAKYSVKRRRKCFAADKLQVMEHRHASFSPDT